jgi:ribosomal protein S18 acetylase RimI-like enzyme
MSLEISDTTDGVDWAALKDALRLDDFDNGRTPDQYRVSHERSHAVVFARDDGGYVANGRILSDGVCNAYLVDIWVATRLRRRGLGGEIVRRLLATVPGQHVALLTAERTEFYESLGFGIEREALSLVNGEWLNPSATR